MSRSELVEIFIATHGISLDMPGLDDRGLSRDHTLSVIRLARTASLPILGGDVWVKRGEVIRPDAAGWHCDQKPNEDRASFARRSCNESEEYVAKFPYHKNDDYLFVLVFDA